MRSVAPLVLVVVSSLIASSLGLAMSVVPSTGGANERAPGLTLGVGASVHLFGIVGFGFVAHTGELLPVFACVSGFWHGSPDGQFTTVSAGLGLWSRLFGVKFGFALGPSLFVSHTVRSAYSVGLEALMLIEGAQSGLSLYALVNGGILFTGSPLIPIFPNGSAHLGLRYSF